MKFIVEVNFHAAYDPKDAARLLMENLWAVYVVAESHGVYTGPQIGKITPYDGIECRTEETSE